LEKVVSTHICDVDIPGLPHKLIGHIVPEMKMASLLGIRILCKAGCKVIFDDEKCRVNYRGNTILMGYEDPASNLWTLPIFQGEGGLQTTPRSDSVVSEPTLSWPGPCKGPAPQPPFVPPPERASFSYHQTTKVNAVKFMHQSLCNPPITSLIKAINALASSTAPHTSMPSPSKNILCQALQHQKAT
jgi:hypothetical protein